MAAMEEKNRSLLLYRTVNCTKPVQLHPQSTACAQLTTIARKDLSTAAAKNAQKVKRRRKISKLREDETKKVYKCSMQQKNQWLGGRLRKDTVIQTSYKVAPLKDCNCSTDAFLLLIAPHT